MSCHEASNARNDSRRILQEYFFVSRYYVQGYRSGYFVGPQIQLVKPGVRGGKIKCTRRQVAFFPPVTAV